MIVIGAGIVGAACADALTQGGLRVVVIEPSLAVSGATGAGMGHLLILDENEAEFSITRYSRDRWNQMAMEMPSSLEYERCGTIWIAAVPEELPLLKQRCAFLQSRQVRAEILDSQQLAEAEPNLRPGLPGGLFIPDDAILYPPAAAGWLLKRAEQRGAAVLTGKRVTHIQAWGVELEDGSRLEAHHVVCATGMWTPQLIGGLPIQPRKGHLVITDRYPGFVRHAVMELGYLKSAHGRESESVAFNVQPRKTGQVLIGSSRQFGVTDARPESRIISSMVQRAIDFMPRIAQLSALRAWTGFRAATPDRLPMVGPVANRPNCLLCAGHEGIGITTCLASAGLVSAFILGDRPPLDPKPYAVERF